MTDEESDKPSETGATESAGLTKATQLRGREFRKLLRTPKTWIWIGLVAAIGLAIGLKFGGPGIGVAVAVVLILIGLIVTFAVASGRSERAFYQAYAEANGLTWHRYSGDLDGTSAFLRKGDKQTVDQLFTGPLADGIEGCLALYTYTEEVRDVDTTTDDTDYPFTVVTVKMPETVEHMKNLRVQRKSGMKALEGFEDAFRRKHERVTLESEEMRDRYEIFVGKEQDPVWTRRLFSPSFIVWLTGTPPKKFAFELEDGYFVAYVPKHRTTAALLDEMREISCHVARQIRDKAANTTSAR